METQSSAPVRPGPLKSDILAWGGGGKSTAPDAPPGPSVKFDLPRGNVIEIRMRSKCTPEEFAKVKRIFELSEVAFVEDEPTGEQQPNSSGRPTRHKTGDAVAEGGSYRCAGCGGIMTLPQGVGFPHCPQCPGVTTWVSEPQ